MSAAAEETYRDSISTVDAQGKRVWLYPKKPKGPFFNARTILSLVLLAILFGLPFVKVGENPFIRLDIINRDFYLFGMHFTPQDFYLFVVLMITTVVFIVLFTVIYGRLFCGWVCPQTIFMELVFRRIEYWIEGDSNQQRKLNAAPWTADKILKKALKQAVFILISITIAHTFLAYLIGPERVWTIITQAPSQNWGGFFAMVGFTGAFYFVFARLREQVCTTICPYGRLQGVMTDANTVLISYDFIRGEPRGKMKKVRSNPVSTVQQAVAISDTNTGDTGEAPIQLGDCIDCGLCVHVCPTGIDIRNGVQLECVNCTACIDACDEVMDKIERPRGLIRYESHNGIVNQQRNWVNARSVAYSVVLLLLIGVNIYLFATRALVETVILRAKGKLFYELDGGQYSNLYNFQMTNKTANDYVPEFVVTEPAGATIQWIGNPPKLSKEQQTEGSFFLILPKSALTSRKTDVEFEIRAGKEVLDKASTTFLGPIK